MADCLSFIKNVFNKVSTKPNRLSYTWHNGISILTYVILVLLYIERCFSLLQWGKYLYRLIVSHFKYSIDSKATRVNVPSYFVEVYFILVSIILYIVSINDGINTSLACSIVALYFLIDSSAWLLYYFFFRRFYEENYAIMHSLEYVVLLPIVIIVQSCCVSILSGVGFHDAIIMLLSSSAYDPLYIIILHLLYTALIFGLVISNLPIENVKVKNDHKHDLAIIGNGDVVKERLMPAVFKRAVNSEKFIKIGVFDIKKSQNDVKNKFYEVTYHKVEESKDLFNSEIAWIATPSFAHYTYLGELIYQNKFIVVEKPITIFQQELNLINKLRKNSWDNVFCLSYYYLEKSLPLSYLYNPLKFYDHYLEFSISREEILTEMESCGRIQKIELYLNEEKDDRQWLRNESYGGHYFETFIHLVVVTMSVIDSDDSLIVDQWMIGDCKQSTGGLIKCMAHTASGIEVYLEMGKFVTKKRNGIIHYENAKIAVDFDERKLSYSSSKGKPFEIAVDKKYDRYDVQLDMVYRCKETNIKPFIIDGSDLQLKAIQWLIDNYPHDAEHFTYDGIE